MAGTANVLIKIGAQTAGAVGEINKVNKALGDQMSSSQKAGAAIKKAAVPAGIALAALGAAAIDCAKAAAEDEAAQVKLAGALKRGTGATDAAVAAAEDYISKLSMATGVSDDELRPALAKLATATGDVTKAQSGLSVALDVSAATGKSVDAVSKALAKAYAGNGAALAKLIPGIDEAAIKSGDFAKINAELARLTGGAAAESANTAAGQFKRFQIAIQETKEGIGAAFLPVLNQVAPILLRVATLAQANTKVFVAVGAAVAAVSAIIIGLNVAMKLYTAISVVVRVATAAWTAAQWLLNAALTANPIGLVIIGVAALAAAIVVAYRRSETFRNIIDKVGTVLQQIASSAIPYLTTAWHGVSTAVGYLIDKLGRFWPLLVPGGAVYVALRFLEDKFGVVSRAASGFRTIIGNLTTTVRGMYDVFVRLLDVIRRVASAISNLNVGGTIGSLLSTVGLTTPGRTTRSSAVASTTQVNVTINGPIDADSTARAIYDVLGQYDRRYGIQVV